MISYKSSLKKLNVSKLNIGIENIDVANCLNRITAANVFNKANNPATDNAAFDGFAINSKETKNLNYKKKKIF